MTITGLLKSTKIVEVNGKKITLKKFPLGYYEYLQAKGMEGKRISYDEEGKATEVNLIYTPKYDVEDIAEQLFNGVSSWELIDETGYRNELSLENCLALIHDFPEFAKLILKQVVAFNIPLVTGEVKKKSTKSLKT